MKLKYLLSTVILLGLFTNSHAQVEPCGQPEMTKALYEQHPELKAKEEQRNAELIAAGEAQGEYVAKDNPVYVIPIVFHVLHEYGYANISDEQIYDQVRILNEDYRKQNVDTTEIVDYFKNRAGDAKIEFRLASIDPYGNPTNGVTRHYTHESDIGDNFSKLEQWPRNRYLNVWVTKSIGSGAAGYSHFPAGTEGPMRYIDGVLILHNHIGSIGTGSPYNSRSLTHEIGHYLNLYHTWGKTNDTNLPGNCSDDDAVEDTPLTIGSATGVCDLGLTTCGDTLDNVQNYMDYSYCSVMYTNGQIKRMRNALVAQTGQRNQLWSQKNIDNSVPDDIIYDPVADFNPDQYIACVGENVQFDNFSWSLSDTVGNNATYNWEFQDGSPATSTGENPTISFTSPGWKTVSLTVEDNGRSNSITKNKVIWVAPNWAVFSDQIQFDFNDSPDYWVIQNPTNLPYQWQVRDDAGKDGTGGIFLNMTNPEEDPIEFSDGYFFDYRRGGSKSTFISQPLNLSYLTNTTVTFDFACATDAINPSDMTEKLQVFVSTDCGNTWYNRKELEGPDLANNGSGWDSFYPDNKTVWTNESFGLPVTLTGEHVLFKFVYIGSDKSNNIAIDNINIQGTVSTESHQKSNGLTVYPNPSNNKSGWNINYDSNQWGGSQFELTDIQGRTVITGTLPKNESKQNVKPATDASNGVYFLKVTNEEKVVQNKLILE